MRRADRMAPPPSGYHWRTGGGAEVDLVLEYNGSLFPIEIKAAATLTGYDIRGLRAFMDTYPDQTTSGVVFYAGSQACMPAPDIYAIPWNTR